MDCIFRFSHHQHGVLSNRDSSASSPSRTAALVSAATEPLLPGAPFRLSLLAIALLLLSIVLPSRAESDPSTPQLTLAYSVGRLLVEWPTNDGNWYLERAIPAKALDWTPVPITSLAINGSNISVTIYPCWESMFFRLSKTPPPPPVGNGLAGTWTFDQIPNPTAQDCGFQESGLSAANVLAAPARIGAAGVGFNGGPADGNGSRLFLSNSNYALLPPQGSPFSVSLWFNPDALPVGWHGIIGTDADGTNGWHVALHNSGPGTNEIVFASPNPDQLNLAGRKLLLPGQWYELTATWDGSIAAIYLDSELLARGPGALTANDAPIYIGGGIAGYDSFLGAIDELRLFTNALSSEDVSLSGSWQMNETNGATLVDSSIRGHHGTLSSEFARVPGKDGSAIDLSASTVVLPNTFADLLPPTGGSFSLSFWLYPNSLPAEWRGLMSCDSFGNRGWRLALHGGDPTERQLRFWSTDSAGTLDLNTPIDLPEQTWSKLDLTFNGAIATVYLNGRQIASDNGGIQGGTAPLILGSVDGMTNFDGLVDELKVYRRERQDFEIGPVANVMWETVLLNTSSNLQLQASGPAGKPLIYALDSAATPTNGSIILDPVTGLATYSAGSIKGPDAFAYTVTDGEFTSPARLVLISVVQPHWLSPTGGPAEPLDGSTPDHAWITDTFGALDAIWHTNNYYDAFFYAPGEYETSGWRYFERGTANPGCKHLGSGSDGINKTILKLVNATKAWADGLIFGNLHFGVRSDGFEAHDMVLDCNAPHNPKYQVGEPVSIRIPLIATSRVDAVRLHWDNSQFNGIWRFGPAQHFTVSTRDTQTGLYVTNSGLLSHTNDSDLVPLGVDTDEIRIELDQRTAGVDFYALAEIEVSGASVSLPRALQPDGSESQLDPALGKYSIVQAVDGDHGSAWASGPEDQVRIILPLQDPGPVTDIVLFWNCHFAENVGRFGPASDYQIQARDAVTGEIVDIPLLATPRDPNGMQVNQLLQSIIADQIIIVLNHKELGVDFYSLRELLLRNGPDAVPLKLPTALNSLTWGNYNILRAFDGSPTSQWASDTQGMCGALSVVGANLKLTNLKIVHFGTKATRECFPLSISGPDGGPPVTLGNITLENCLLTDPATNNTDGITAVRMLGVPPYRLTNAVARGCSIQNVASQFRYSHGFSASHIESCIVADTQIGVYFEPNPDWGDNVGPILVRSNQFLNVDSGIFLAFATAARFDSLACVANEIVLNGQIGWGFSACDTCSAGPSGSITNVVLMQNIIRHPGWLANPYTFSGGIHCSDIQNAMLANNIITLGGLNDLRLRSCPSGIIPVTPVPESCDAPAAAPLQASPSYPPCLDSLPLGYRRAWLGNRGFTRTPLSIRFLNQGSEGLATQQQWR